MSLARAGPAATKKRPCADSLAGEAIRTISPTGQQEASEIMMADHLALIGFAHRLGVSITSDAAEATKTRDDAQLLMSLLRQSSAGPNFAAAATASATSPEQRGGEFGPTRSVSLTSVTSTDAAASSSPPPPPPPPPPSLQPRPRPTSDTPSHVPPSRSTPTARGPEGP